MSKFLELNRTELMAIDGGINPIIPVPVAPIIVATKVVVAIVKAIF